MIKKILSISFSFLFFVSINSQAETVVTYDQKNNFGMILVKTRGPRPVVESDRDAERFMNALAIEGQTNQSVLKKIAKVRIGEFELSCSLVLGLANSNCVLSFRNNRDLEVFAPEFRFHISKEGADAAPYYEALMGKGNSSELSFEDSVGKFSIYLSPTKILLKAKS